MQLTVYKEPEPTPEEMEILMRIPDLERAIVAVAQADPRKNAAEYALLLSCRNRLNIAIEDAERFV